MNKTVHEFDLSGGTLLYAWAYDGQLWKVSTKPCKLKFVQEEKDLSDFYSPYDVFETKLKPVETRMHLEIAGMDVVNFQRIDTK